MKKKNIAGVIAIVAIIAAVIFAGCVEEEEAPTASFPTPTATPTPEITESPTPTSTPTATSTPVANVSPSQSPTPTPKPVERAEISTISDVKPVDYEGYPALNVSIFGTKFTGDLNVTVKNEDGDILDTVTISPEKEHGWIRTNLRIGDYHETLRGLSYKFTVIVSDAQGELKDNTFRLDGAKVTIEDDPYLDMFKVENEQGNTIYFVHELSYTLRNEGDLPAYPRSAKFKGSTFDLSDTILGHKERFSHSLSMELYKPPPPENTHYFGLYISDDEGKTLAHTTWEVYLKY